MTVESSSRKQSFAGGQSVLSFSFRTLVAHPEFIKVTETSSLGVETQLTYNVDYTVALNANGVGGIVTVSPTFGTGFTQTVFRDTDDLQESDYDDFNQFPADTLEDDLDRRTLISQERSDDLDRTAKLPISYTGASLTLPLPQDGYSLVWSGGTLVNSNLVGATGPTGPTGPAGPVSAVSSSTTDITVTTNGTISIISSVNAGTGGSNKILRLNSSGGLPALDGSLLTGIRGPVLAAFSSVTQASITTAVQRTFNNTTLDSGGYWSGSVYTPLIAGYYYVTYMDTILNGTSTTVFLYIYKNGSYYNKIALAIPTGFTSNPLSGVVSAIIQMNGSTDTLSFFISTPGGSATAQATDNFVTIVRVY